jgi:hypothetical protein
VAIVKLMPSKMLIALEASSKPAALAFVFCYFFRCFCTKKLCHVTIVG